MRLPFPLIAANVNFKFIEGVIIQCPGIWTETDKDSSHSEQCTVKLSCENSFTGFTQSHSLVVVNRMFPYISM